MVACTVQNCDLIFSNGNELYQHIKQLHSALISVKFASRPDQIITLYRDNNTGKFTCPGCDVQHVKYQQMYNHCTRVSKDNLDHVRNLDKYFQVDTDKDGGGRNIMDTGEDGSTLQDGDNIDNIFQTTQQVCAEVVNSEC
jgi:hypothetical protein